jgi:hypothetical protein
MRNLPLATLMIAVAALVAPAAQAATSLISNGSFAPATTTPKAGYMQAVTGWSGTGMKNVGADNGLWLGVTTSVFNGSLSRTGWDLTPNANQSIKVPAGCTAPTLNVNVEFVGASPEAGSGLRVTVGTQTALVGWSSSPRIESVKLSALPAGALLVDLASIKGAKQVSGVRNGIRVHELAVSCN